MAKETFYFTHDYNARNDLKICVLREDFGMEGVGVYWCIVEMLYEEGGYISLDDVDDIAKTLRTNTTVVRGVIDSKLFQQNETHFYSNAVLNRLKKREERSEKARKSVLARYKTSTNEYDRIQSNTIKEKKRKENNNKEKYKKEKEIESCIPTDGIDKGSIDNIYAHFSLFWEKYPRKVAKAAAEKSFAKLKPDKKLLNLILEKLELYKKSDAWQKDGGQFIPYPATWLNGRRWEDEITGGVNGKTNSRSDGKILKPDEFTDPEEYFRKQRNEH
jgi:hypothetical protein